MDEALQLVAEGLLASFMSYTTARPHTLVLSGKYSTHMCRPASSYYSNSVWDPAHEPPDHHQGQQASPTPCGGPESTAS